MTYGYFSIFPTISDVYKLLLILDTKKSNGHYNELFLFELIWDGIGGEKEL